MHPYDKEIRIIKGKAEVKNINIIIKNSAAK